MTVLQCADGQDQAPLEIDFEPGRKGWPRIPFMSGLREALGLQGDPSWPANTALHTEEARQYFLRLVSPARHCCSRHHGLPAAQGETQGCTGGFTPVCTLPCHQQCKLSQRESGHASSRSLAVRHIKA